MNDAGELFVLPLSLAVVGFLLIFLLCMKNRRHLQNRLRAEDEAEKKKK